MDREFVDIINFTALENRGWGVLQGTSNTHFQDSVCKDPSSCSAQLCGSWDKLCPGFAWLPGNPDPTQPSEHSLDAWEDSSAT